MQLGLVLFIFRVEDVARISRKSAAQKKQDRKVANTGNKFQVTNRSSQAVIKKSVAEVSKPKNSTTTTTTSNSKRNSVAGFGDDEPVRLCTRRAFIVAFLILYLFCVRPQLVHFGFSLLLSLSCVALITLGTSVHTLPVVPRPGSY